MQFYDMHSHILPNIDDGAKTLEDSLKSDSSVYAPLNFALWLHHQESAVPEVGTLRGLVRPGTGVSPRLKRWLVMVWGVPPAPVKHSIITVEGILFHSL